ncbi:MAG TPA: hypothetical protein VGF86_05340 [Candidatus Tumulicola sp.]|jgi:hypothetical protein
MDAHLTIVAATSLEARAVRRALPGATVFETGIALARRREGWGDTVVSCGLAGALRGDLPTGTVLVPVEVVRPDGTRVRCADDLVAAYVAAARSLGFEPVCDPMLTSAGIVRGAERAVWARRGCAGVDMETGLLHASRLAAVRVVLDTPERELHADWLHPARALLDPRNWPEARWLARDAPRCARRAAEVVAAARH